MPQGQQGSIVAYALLYVPLILIFYFMLIRPQRLKEKEHQKMLAGLQKNDNVITSGGIHGTIVSVKEKTLVLRIDENVKMEVEKSSIAQKV